MSDTPVARSEAPRRRLNWFSPLRPASTAIAEYAMTTIPALAQHADVVVWTERQYWPLELERYAAVRQWDGLAWPALNAADTTLYHVGNNVRFHGWIVDVARQHPGVVVLHETRLHELFAALLLDNAPDETPYLHAVRRCHGVAAALEVQRFVRGEVTASDLAETVPLTELAVERARGAVVHTGTAFTEAVALGRCPVIQLDLPYDAGQPPPTRTWDGVLRLVVFGYLAANRRIDVLLDAIATLPERQQVRLDIAGQIDDPAPLVERIQNLGLGDIVRLLGFMPEADLDGILARAHLAVNLRNPTMGEASHSQLRIWSHGLASVVTRTGWYADAPSDTVAFVDPANEIADLQRHLRHALAHPETLQIMGEAGRRHLEARHAPDTYASELIAGLDRIMQSHASTVGATIGAVSRVLAESGMPPAARASLARRAAGEVSRWTA